MINGKLECFIKLIDSEDRSYTKIEREEGGGRVGRIVNVMLGMRGIR